MAARCGKKQEHQSAARLWDMGAPNPSATSKRTNPGRRRGAFGRKLQEQDKESGRQHSAKNKTRRTQIHRRLLIWNRMKTQRKWRRDWGRIKTEQRYREMNRWPRTETGNWSTARVGIRTEATEKRPSGRAKIGAPTEAPGTLAQLKKNKAHTDPAAPWLRESPNPSA
jgi:hypothetical protein